MIERKRFIDVRAYILHVLISFIAGSCAVFFLQWQQQNRSSNIEIKQRGGAPKNIVDYFNDEKIVAFSKWDVTGGDEYDTHNLLCFVRAFDSDPNYESKGVKLSIYDDSKKVIYEDTFSSIDEIRTLGGRYDAPPQLVLNVNYGGNANVLQILGYQNGKVVEMLNEMNGSGYEIRPQFRTSIIPAKELFQVTVISDGLASGGEKFADVYRYKDGKYYRIGQYSQTKADDFIERAISR